MCDEVFIAFDAHASSTSLALRCAFVPAFFSAVDAFLSAEGLFFQQLVVLSGPAESQFRQQLSSEFRNAEGLERGHHGGRTEISQRQQRSRFGRWRQDGTGGRVHASGCGQAG